MTNQGLEKMKFYDTWLKILFGSLLLEVVLFFTYPYIKSNIIFVFVYLLIFPMGISLLVIFGGMVHNQYKRKEWGFFAVTVILAFVYSAGFLISLIYYFAVMRKEFKKGKGKKSDFK